MFNLISIWFSIIISRALNPLEAFLQELEVSKNGIINDPNDKLMKKLMLEFDKADLDKDGTINFSEFTLKILGAEIANTDQSNGMIKNLKDHFAAQDLNGDGKISKQEFQTMINNYLNPNTFEI